MIFIIPVSASDFDKLPKFVKVLQKLGGLGSHKGILIPTQEVASKAFEIARPLEMLFGEYTEIKLSVNPSEGWPYACNVHFQHAVSSTIGLLDGPFMWMELDCCPIKNGWADTLQREYISKERPYMGPIRDTAPRVNWPCEGQHMVGVAIYPQDFHRRTVLWNYPGTDPFDIFMRDAIFPFAAPTDSIGHFYHSREYEVSDDGGIHCKGEFGQLEWIEGNMVVVHGVKDDSLYDIIIDGWIPGDGVRLPLGTPSESLSPNVSSLDEMADILRKAGYTVITPDALEDEDEDTSDRTEWPSLSKESLDLPEQISTHPNDLQGDPAMGLSIVPHETKDAVASNAINVQLPKRGRPRKVVK
jgi:hypothetical protein